MTKPTHPVELLACAIASQEGAFTRGKTPSIRNNPGDIRYAQQVGATRPDGTAGPVHPNTPEPIAVFSSLPLGVSALYRQLWLQVAHGQTVRQIISSWAPANENDTSTYLENVLTWTELPADVSVLSLLPPLTQLN